MSDVLRDLWIMLFSWSHCKNTKSKNVWFSTVPLGHNKLNSMVKTMMAISRMKGYFTNHSLRTTAMSRLCQEGVDDKLIREAPEHRSEALRSLQKGTKQRNNYLSFENSTRPVQRNNNQTKCYCCTISKCFGWGQLLWIFQLEIVILPLTNAKKSFKLLSYNWQMQERL